MERRWIMYCIVLVTVMLVYHRVFFLMIRRPPRSTLDRSSAASDVYKRQGQAAAARRAPGGLRLRDQAGEPAGHGGAVDGPGSCLLYTSPSPTRPY